jgi:hypothetical protein
MFDYKMLLQESRAYENGISEWSNFAEVRIDIIKSDEKVFCRPKFQS